MRSGEVWTCLTVQLCRGILWLSSSERSDRRGLLRGEQTVCFAWRAMKSPNREICAWYPLSTSTMPLFDKHVKDLDASWALYISGVFPERIMGLRAVRRKEGGKEGRLGLQHWHYEVRWVTNGSLTPKTTTIFSLTLICMDSALTDLCKH